MNDNDNDKKYLMDEESAKKYQKTVDSFHIPAFYKLLIKEGKLTEGEYFEKVLPEKRLKKIEKQIAELEKKQTHAIDNQVVFNKGIMEQIAELKEFDKGSQKWSVLIEAILRELTYKIKYHHEREDRNEQIASGCEPINEYEELLEKLESPKQTEKKEKMTDDEIMRFNEEFMAKINKRKVQPLEDSGGEDIDYEKWREEMKEKYPASCYESEDSGGSKSVELGLRDSKDEVSSRNTEEKPLDSLTRFRNKVLEPFNEKSGAKERNGEHTIPEIRGHPEVNVVEIQPDSKLPEQDDKGYVYFDEKEYSWDGNYDLGGEKTEPEREYPKVVYQLGSDSKEYVELKKKYNKLIEDFLEKLEFLRDSVLEAPIISGNVQDLRDHVHDVKDLIVKDIKEYAGRLKK